MHSKLLLPVARRPPPQLKATAIRLRSEHPDVNNFIVALDKAVGFDTGKADMIYSDEPSGCFCFRATDRRA